MPIQNWIRIHKSITKLLKPFQLDGYIARRFPGQASSLGSFLDPLADKVLVTALYLSLTYVGIIPAALTSLVVSRDVLLVYAGLYIRYMSVVPPVCQVLIYKSSSNSRA